MRERINRDVPMRAEVTSCERHIKLDCYTAALKCDISMIDSYRMLLEDMELQGSVLCDHELRHLEDL